MSQMTHFQPRSTAAGGDVDLSSLPAGVIGGASAATMFAGLFWMLATDRLITGPAHRREIAVKDQQIVDKDAQVVLWRAVGETAQAQTAELLEHSRLSVQLLQGIAAQARDKR